jgi:hypothetical protein
MGRGLTVLRSLKGNLYRTRRAGIIQANLPEGIARFRTLFGIAEANITEEPDAEIPHAGICTGAVEQMTVLPLRRTSVPK